MRAEAQLALRGHGDEEPDGRGLRDDEQRDDLHCVGGLCQAVDEEDRVADAVVDHAEPHDFDRGAEAGEWDHVLTL